MFGQEGMQSYTGAGILAVNAGLPSTVESDASNRLDRDLQAPVRASRALAPLIMARHLVAQDVTADPPGVLRLCCGVARDRRISVEIPPCAMAARSGPSGSTVSSVVGRPIRRGPEGNKAFPFRDCRSSPRLPVELTVWR